MSAWVNIIHQPAMGTNLESVGVHLADGFVKGIEHGVSKGNDASQRIVLGFIQEMS